MTNDLTPAARRYDLDWLRVIAFAILIFYHIGMFYVTWGWHVKSVYASSAVEPLMLIVNPWRLALLFFISGVAIRYASDKAPSLVGFAGSRFLRLGAPILFGMTVIVAPQSYFELRQAGAIPADYWSFWGQYLSLEQYFYIATPTWNHLWYVVYLLVYILLIVPFIPVLRSIASGALGDAMGRLLGGPVGVLLIIPLPFVAYTLLLDPLFPTTHALVGDWANHAHRFTMFMLGYLLAKNQNFWKGVDRAFVPAIVLAASFLVMRFTLRFANEEIYRTLFGDPTFLPTMLAFYAWASIVVLLGFGQRFLNKKSDLLRYLTSAIFCYYIVHQTITISVGVFLTERRLGVGVEFVLLSLATVVGCVAAYEVFKRIPIVRTFFGINSTK